MSLRRDKVIGIVIIVVIALGELVILGRSFWHQQGVQATEVASELVMQISLLDSSLRSGDQAQFDKAQRNFSAQLATFSRNIFAKRQHKQLIADLQNYEKILNESHYVEDLRAMSQVRNVFLSQLENLSLENYSRDDLTKLSTIFSEYKEDLQGLNIQQLTRERDEILKSIELSQSALKQIADCISVCTDAEFLERQNNFSTQFGAIVTSLDAQNAELAAKFDSAKLARQLKDIAKNS
ncbi:hypothetical protein IJ847_00960 [Candidatus Saccharibacteria bacterium]|nr:hypothetical protein [Candidatus Saccharibacteria bacterium]